MNNNKNKTKQNETYEEYCQKMKQANFLAYGMIMIVFLLSMQIHF